jgi:hypothetical protein
MPQGSLLGGIIEIENTGMKGSGWIDGFLGTTVRQSLYITN